MPRKNIIRQGEYPYHITTRSNQRSWFVPDLSIVWGLAMEALAFANKKHPVIVHCFVLMGNHYHLLITTPDSNIDSFMYEFNKQFSKELRHESNLINKMFGGRYKSSIIDNQRYYLAAIRYIIQNPLRAKIISNIEKYPYSTYYYMIHGIKISYDFKIEFPLENIAEVRKWLSEPIKEKELGLLKKGFQRQEFHICRDRNSRKIIEI